MLFLLICQKSEATETLRQNLKNLAGAVNLGVFRKFAHSVCLFICLSCHSFSNNTTPSLPVFPSLYSWKYWWARSHRDVIWLRHCHCFFLAYQMKALGLALYLFDRLVVFIKTLVNLSIVISLIQVFRQARFTLSNCFCDHSRNFAWVNYSKFWRICKKCLRKLTLRTYFFMKI